MIVIVKNNFTALGQKSVLDFIKSEGSKNLDPSLRLDDRHSDND